MSDENLSPVEAFLQTLERELRKFEAKIHAAIDEAVAAVPPPRTPPPKPPMH
jgi:hypothetical protein